MYNLIVKVKMGLKRDSAHILSGEESILAEEIHPMQKISFEIVLSIIFLK